MKTILGSVEILTETIGQLNIFTNKIYPTTCTDILFLTKIQKKEKTVKNEIFIVILKNTIPPQLCLLHVYAGHRLF